MTPTHHNPADDPALQARVLELLKVLRQNRGVVRTSLERYFWFFSDDTTAPVGGVDRHIPTVVLDFLRWTDNHQSLDDHSQEQDTSTIHVIAIAQLTVWHELYPDSTQYRHNPLSVYDSIDEIDVESLLAFVGRAIVENECAPGEPAAKQKTNKPQSDFKHLNEAVVDWFRKRKGETHATRDDADPQPETIGEDHLTEAYRLLEREYFGLAKHLVGNAHDAEDLYGDVVEDLARYYATPDSGSRGLGESFKTILRRRFIDLLRKRIGAKNSRRDNCAAASRDRFVTNHTGLEDASSAELDPVCARMEAHEQDRWLMKYLLGRKPKAREMMIGHFIDGLEVNDVPIKVQFVLGIGVRTAAVYEERNKQRAALSAELQKAGWSISQFLSGQRKKKKS